MPFTARAEAAARLLDSHPDPFLAVSEVGLVLAANASAREEGWRHGDAVTDMGKVVRHKAEWGWTVVLRRDENGLRCHFDMAPTGQSEFGCVNVGGKVEELTGFSSAQLIGRTIGQVLPLDEAVRLRTRCNRAFSKERTSEGNVSWAGRLFDLRCEPRAGGVRILVTEATPSESRARLSASHRRMRNVLAQVPVGILSLAEDEFYMNSRLEAMTGWSAEEIPTVDAWFDIMYSDDPGRGRALYEIAKAEDLAGVYEIPVIRRDGESRVFRFRGSQGPRQEVWAVADITEEIAVAERFRALYEGSADAVLVLVGNHVTDANPAALALFEAAGVQELVGCSMFDLSAPEMLTEKGMNGLDRALDEIAATGRARLDWTHLSLKGRPFTVEATVSRVRVDGQDALLISARDVQERNTVRREAVQAKAMLDRAQLATQTGSWEMQSDDEATLVWSLGMYRLMGRDPVNGLPPWRDFVGAMSPEERRTATRALRRVQTGHPHPPVSYGARDALGEMRRYRVTLGLDDATAKVVGVVQDVTDLDRAREELAHTNVELLGARDEALSSARAKSRFLATMSHELRTPLNAVLGMTSLLLDQTLDKDVRETVQTIETSGLTLLRVLDDILDFSKIDAGKVGIEPVPSVLRDVVGDVAALHRARAIQRGITLSVEIRGSTSTRVLADSVRLSQVLGNLVGNAVKFTAVGGVAIVLTTEVVGDDLAAEFIVSDTGIGIPQEKADDVFRSFIQADPSIRRRYGGTGLGLAISLHLVQLMGGSLAYAPAPGGGSVFSFTLRFPRVSEVVRRAPAIQPLRSGLRVLLAEDHPVNVHVAVAMLHRLECEVEVVGDGHGAIAAASARSFDVILMDVQMPGCDGLEATRAIRRHEQGTHVPILALTANAMPDDRIECEAAGMDGFLAKPLSLADLSQGLATAVAFEGAPDMPSPR